MKSSLLLKNHVLEKQKQLLQTLSRKAGMAALVFFILAFGASFRLPWWITWENGPVEMLQNVILLEGLFLCLYYYFKDKKRTIPQTLAVGSSSIVSSDEGASKVDSAGAGAFNAGSQADGTGSKPLSVSPGVWILGVLIFLLLLGREISWGRVFFLTGIGRFGPEFTDQSQLAYYKFVKPFVAVLGVMILYGFYRWFPRRPVWQKLPFPKFPFAMLCLCAVISLLGDGGILKRLIGNAAAIALEECTEVDIYFLLVYFVWYYHKWFVLLNKGKLQ